MLVSIAVTCVGLVLAAAGAIQGTHPPKSKRARRTWAAAFIVLGILNGALTFLKDWIDERQQAATNQTIRSTADTVEQTQKQVEEIGKRPPVQNVTTRVINVQPSTRPSRRALIGESKTEVHRDDEKKLVTLTVILKNFGEAMTSVRISADSSATDVDDDVSNLPPLDFRPGGERAVDLLLEEPLEDYAKYWSGEKSVEVRVRAKYKPSATECVEFTYLGNLDGPTEVLETRESRTLPASGCDSR